MGSEPGQTDDLINIFRCWKLPCSTENRLQAAIEEMLVAVGIPFEREKRIAKGVIDFLVEGIGVECKISGTYQEVMEQVARYCYCDEINEILLVTSCTHHRKLEGLRFQGKVIRVYWISLW